MVAKVVEMFGKQRVLSAKIGFPLSLSVRSRTLCWRIFTVIVHGVA